jgi:hypothetical protein
VAKYSQALNLVLNKSTFIALKSLHFVLCISHPNRIFTDVVDWQSHFFTAK